MEVESNKVLPEELPESFWMALTFTLIVAMIGIIYTILQEIVSKKSKFAGNRSIEIKKKCVEYVRYWRKYKNLKEGGPGRVQTATSCGNTPMGGPITGARLNNQRFSTSSVGIHGPQGWSELVRDFQNFQRFWPSRF